MALCKLAAAVFLILNIAFYFIIIVLASWAVNQGIERSRESASVLSIPARIFPLYFPMGNMATGFFVTFALIAGVVGITTSFTGLHDLMQSTPANLPEAFGSAVISSSLTLLASGLARKEIDHIGWTNTNLRTLEVVTIIVSATQILYTGAIHACSR